MPRSSDFFAYYHRLVVVRPPLLDHNVHKMHARDLSYSTATSPRSPQLPLLLPGQLVIRERILRHRIPPVWNLKNTSGQLYSLPHGERMREARRPFRPQRGPHEDRGLCLEPAYYAVAYPTLSKHIIKEWTASASSSNLAKGSQTARLAIDYNITFEQAATILVALGTGVLGLYTQSPSPENVSLHLELIWEPEGAAAYSGTRAFIVGGAASLGHYTIITTTSPHNEALLKSLDATHVLDRARSNGSILNELPKITDGKPIEVASFPYNRDTAVALFEHVTGWPEKGLLKVSMHGTPDTTGRKSLGHQASRASAGDTVCAAESIEYICVTSIHITMEW
ncbi:hypothetical protein C8Q77DRAFT_1071582 [Trametes polyzona]|nr:hypothetical protein C8Q77DRAFT_1071582 [Trametes polyzona]